MAPYSVGYFVGSLAKASINRKLALALVRLAPQELRLAEIPFRDLPLYSYDYDAEFPPVARALKEAIATVDAVLFVTPEYNRSIPGGLGTPSTGQVGRMVAIRSPASRRASSAHRRDGSEQQSDSSIFEASWRSATLR